MVTTTFDALAKKADSMDIESRDVLEARNWYRTEASKIRVDNERRLIDPKNVVYSITPRNIGQMFMFFYSPKNKDTLPYYDRFPLVFPINFYDDGFLGMNLHYLPRRMRASLMDALYTTINNKKNDKTTRLRISYDILNNSSRMRYFKPCLKRYLNEYVVQKFVYIEPVNWDKAIMLPTERFSKKSAAYVQAESASSLRGKIYV